MTDSIMSELQLYKKAGVVDTAANGTDIYLS